MPQVKVEMQSDACCRVEGLQHRPLHRCLAQLPGTSFDRKPRCFWTGSGVYAEFGFKGHVFVIEGDPWDDSLWICSKDELGHAEEMQEIREHLEKHARSG